MDIFLLIALMVVAVLVFIQLRSTAKARDMEGMVVPDTSAVDGDINCKHKVYFFHPSHCGPRKSILPLVDEIRRRYPNLIKVEVSEHVKLAGTPTFFAVDDGTTLSVKPGLASEKWLRSLLDREHR